MPRNPSSEELVRFDFAPAVLISDLLLLLVSFRGGIEAGMADVALVVLVGAGACLVYSWVFQAGPYSV
jgi:hypothetical protein